MNYDFTTVIERKGTDDLMHEALLPRWHRDDLYPMWVADMGFAVCPDIVEAMRERLEHPIFGYTMEPRDFKPSIIDWVKGHHQWNIQEEWISYIPGIVKGIAFACNVFLKDDEKVVVMPPVYHPFFLIPRFNNKEVVWNPLKMQGDGRFRIDFENLATVCDEKCKLLILCNPHNPCGVCWTKDELVKLADFCHERGIIVISDEIHCDMALFGNKHIPFATVSEKAADISITFQAPSKTFNIAGIVSSYAVIPNATIRKRYFSWLHGTELNEAHLFAYIATTAAYRKGEAWRRQMIHAIEENVLFVEKYFAEKIPGIDRKSVV